MPSEGVFLESTALGVVLPVLFNTGDYSINVRLWVSDDSITPNYNILSGVELTNDGYAPYQVDRSNLSVVYNPAVHWSVTGVSWDLGPPNGGSATIFGWSLSADTIPGQPQGLWGGNFDPPVLISPTGLALNISTIDLYLSDCSDTVSVSGAASIGDGGFEIPALSVGVSSTGWTGVGNPWVGNAILTHPAASGVYPQAAEGSQYAMFGGSSETLAQVVSVPTSAYYVLGLALAGVGAGIGQSLTVSVDGVLQWTAVAQSAWTPWYSPEYFLTTGDHTISFGATGSLGLLSTVCLDGLSLSARP